MSKLDKIGYYDKTNGEDITFDIYKAILSEENRKKYRDIFYKLDTKPLDLTVEELETIRKLQGAKTPHIVNLKYSKGFYMVSQSQEDLYEKLNLITVSLLTMCGFRMNKNGLLKYRNGRAIKTFKNLREYFNFSHYKWSIVKSDIDNYNLIKEQIHDDEKYLVINPLYTSSQYEITMYKFMAFHNELKDMLNPIDYLYLCKKFDIIP